MEEFLRFPGPVNPIRVENYIPVYSSDQIEAYGEPEGWGVVSYLVVQTRESAQPMVTDYNMEQERRGSLRPVHRYNRVERFESTLYQLIACRGKVPRDVIDMIKKIGYDDHPDRIWDSIRDILKKKNMRLYYNRIPTILQILGYARKIDFNDLNSFVIDVVSEFKKINYKFDLVKIGLEVRSSSLRSSSLGATSIRYASLTHS